MRSQSRLTIETSYINLNLRNKLSVVLHLVIKFENSNYDHKFSSEIFKEI